MDFAFPEEFELIRRTARGFVTDRLKPLEQEVEEADELAPERAAALRRASVELGLYAHNLPTALGGGGLPLLGQVVIAEEAGRTTMALGEALGWLPETLRLCDERHREWLVDPVVRGEKIVAYALTEPNAGSDLGRVETRARRAAGAGGGGWVLNGAKQFVSWADVAEFVLVLAVTEPSGGLKERFTVFVVERDNPGFKPIRRFRKMGWRGYPIAAFALDDCFVPDDHVVGGVGGGFAAIMATINGGRINVASRCIGTAEELLRLAVEHAKERITFGKRLADHQAIQFRFADIDLDLEAARLLVHKAAWLGDWGHPDARVAASRAKLAASEMLGRVADSVLQIFGGAGYVCDLPIERMYRDARAFRIGEGTSEMQRLQIARHVLG